MEVGIVQGKVVIIADGQTVAVVVGQRPDDRAFAEGVVFKALLGKVADLHVGKVFGAVIQRWGSGNPVDLVAR